MPKAFATVQTEYAVANRWGQISLLHVLARFVFYRVDGAIVDGSDLHGRMANLQPPFLPGEKRGFLRQVGRCKANRLYLPCAYKDGRSYSISFSMIWTSHVGAAAARSFAGFEPCQTQAEVSAQ